MLGNYLRKIYFLEILKLYFFLFKYSALERNGHSISSKLLIIQCKFESNVFWIRQVYNVKSTILTKSRGPYALKQSTWRWKNKVSDFSENNFFLNGSQVLENKFSLPGIACVTHQSSFNIFRAKIFDMSLLTFRQAREVGLCPSIQGLRIYGVGTP